MKKQIILFLLTVIIISSLCLGCHLYEGLDGMDISGVTLYENDQGGASYTGNADEAIYCIDGQMGCMDDTLTLQEIGTDASGNSLKVCQDATGAEYPEKTKCTGSIFETLNDTNISFYNVNDTNTGFITNDQYDLKMFNFNDTPVSDSNHLRNFTTPYKGTPYALDSTNSTVTFIDKQETTYPDVFLSQNEVNAMKTLGINTGSSSSGSSSSGSSESGSSDSSTSSDSRTKDSSDTKSPCKTSFKCLAHYGTQPGGNLCCGQKGSLTGTAYVCPKEMPTCTGYKCGEQWGVCTK